MSPVIDLQSRLQAVLGDSYRIERELGGGGMSRVFLAQEVELARKVVVKVLPPDMAAGLNAERFRREIQMAASLQHPHIVPLIASGRSDDLVWYTMPFIEGESLRAKLARERELPVSDAVRILRDVTDALSYAHEHGVVHRDIKPDNVLITGRHAVVTDFGVAKAVSASTGESSLTSIGVALGTPAYMAPEQASADPLVDHRADIYSLGVMAYEMLTGSTPFSGAPQMVLAAHVTQAPEPVTQRRATVPPALATIIMRSLEKKAADRWQTASELHQQFELMATPSGGAVPTSAVPATPARTVSSRPSWLIPAVVGGALVAAVAAYVGFKSGSDVDEVALDSHLVAVLPFRVAGADPSLHYLRQGMVDLLQAKLTGEGGPRAADARSVLAAFRDAGGTDENDVADDHVHAIARKVGAARVLQGSIVGPPEHVVLSASLLEIPGARSLAQTTVEGPKDSLFSMVDRLAAQLLALGAGATSQQLGSLTTTSLDALRAYLDGVAAMRRGAWAVATPALRRAVQLDSSFALAGSALLESNGWSGGTPDIGHVRELTWQYRDRLSAKDQLILSIRVGSRYPDVTPHHEQLADRERATQQMADNPEAWYYLGDELFHFGPMTDVRNSLQRAKEAFLRALQLDSAYGGPVTHLASVAAIEGDTAGLRRWVARMRALDSSNVMNIRLVGWALASQTGDVAGIKELLQVLDSTPRLPERLQTFFPFDTSVIAYREQIANADRKQAVSMPQKLAAAQRRLMMLLNMGRLQELEVLIDTVSPTPQLRRGSWIAKAWFGTLYGGLRVSLDSVPVPESVPEIPPAEPLFAREVVRLTNRDASTVDRTVAALQKINDAEASRMAAILNAWGAVVRGRPNAASLLERADSAVRGWETNHDSWHVILGPCWEELGRIDKALVAIRRRRHPLGFPSHVGGAMSARHEGRIAAKAGDRAGAITAYERYLVLRKNPDPALVPQRDSVIAELAALRR